jgi:hypothetical protein
VEIVEFEALDETAVEQHGSRQARGAAGADDHGLTCTLKAENGVCRDPRPWQLRPDQSTADPVE